MTTKRALLTLFVVSVMVFATRNAKAGCWGYGEGDEGECSGANGCTGFCIVTYCDIGCVSGECNGTGNSRECCGNRIDYAQIDPDGGTCDFCGNVRTHARTSHTCPTTQR